MTQQDEKLIIALKPQAIKTVVDEHGKYVLDQHGNYQYEYGSPLGFATRYDPNGQLGVERNRRAFKWAYNDYFERDGLVYVKDYTWKNNQRVEWEEPATVQPMIVSNVPLRNFSIASTVSRSTTNNKLWRILDPRVFELEISTANMEDILNAGTVVKGVIQDQCKWDLGKSGMGKVKLVIVE